MVTLTITRTRDSNVDTCSGPLARLDKRITAGRIDLWYVAPSQPYSIRTYPGRVRVYIYIYINDGIAWQLRRKHSVVTACCVTRKDISMMCFGHFESLPFICPIGVCMYLAGWRTVMYFLCATSAWIKMRKTWRSRRTTKKTEEMGAKSFRVECVLFALFFSLSTTPKWTTLLWRDEAQKKKLIIKDYLNKKDGLNIQMAYAENGTQSKWGTTWKIGWLCRQWKTRQCTERHNLERPLTLWGHRHLCGPRYGGRCCVRRRQRRCYHITRERTYDNSRAHKQKDSAISLTPSLPSISGYSVLCPILDALRALCHRVWVFCSVHLYVCSSSIVAQSYTANTHPRHFDCCRRGYWPLHTQQQPTPPPKAIHVPMWCNTL